MTDTYTSAACSPPLATLLLAIAASASMIVATNTRAAPSEHTPVAVLRLDGAIHPASLRYVERGLREAAQQNAFVPGIAQ